MEDFISSQLFSVIVGAGLTLITSLFINRRTVTNSLDTEIAKEKIEAYKKLYETVCKLNHNLSPYDSVSIPKECFLGYIEVNGKEYPKDYCFPTVFLSVESLYSYKAEIATILNNKRIFVEQSLVNKISFLDSYLGEICHLVNKQNDYFVQMMGFALSNEIDEMVRDIEGGIQDFFNSDKKKITISNFGSTYEHEYKHYTKTLLYNWFVKETETHCFGEFPLCLSCTYQKKCPLNYFVKTEEKNISDC